MEAAWQLSLWDDIQEKDMEEESDTPRCWSSDLAMLLLAAKSRAKGRFFSLLELMRAQEASHIAATSLEEGSQYQRSYAHVVNLQVLEEVEQAARRVLLASDRDLPKPEDLSKLFEGWTTRIAFGEYSLESQEPVLRTRRCVLELARERLKQTLGKEDLLELVCRELGECAILAAKVARKAGQVKDGTFFSKTIISFSS